MNIYQLPEFDSAKIKNRILKFIKSKFLLGIILLVIMSCGVGFAAGIISISYFQNQIDEFLRKIEINLPIIEKPAQDSQEYASSLSYEQAIINVVKEASPSVLSIIVSKDLPIYEQQWINPFGDLGPFGFEIPQYIQKGTEKKEIGGGTGFVVSEDGLVLTNKHVVLDKKAEYTVLTNDGQKYPAKVSALDPVQDLAIIKIESAQKFKAIKLGDSSEIQIGQSVIAIGNALGEFRNTVSVGVISGLERTIFASGTGGFSETLEDIIQTDAAINTGNSGGPLLNLKGEVIGVNTAMAQGAEAIGFAIPINKAKRDIEQVIKSNKISYPFLGVRYVLINEQVKEKNNLSVDYGVWVIKGSKGEPAVIKNSAAQKAGLKEKDIILEFNKEKITQNNSMAKIISKYNPEDKVVLKILRHSRPGKDEKEMDIDVILDERSE
ncbi:MAG: hypothetical protein CEN87_177 [Parcubacteria group bacterium Licking1014_1]|nr:MAG: hypothetical protein CEN87_177 [Parcubacteria group bacterium Licking1014_1]